MGLGIGTTYSFTDLTGSLVSPIAGTLILGGQLGVGHITFINAIDHTAHDVAADGLVMPSFVAGNNGSIQIECQQTSSVHKFLVAWINALKLLAMRKDVSNWATTSGLFRNIVDGSIHQASGISPNKIPDKSYAAQGARVVWTLPTASLISL